MVRVAKASSRRRKIDLNQYYSLNNKLLNRHFLNLFIVFVIGLAISLYYFLLSIEERSERPHRKPPHSVQSVIEKKESSAAAHSGLKEDMSLAAVNVYPASRVIASKWPFLVYGTAWKKAETAHHVSQAVRSGFRFIDTACQPKHYNEPGVGEGWTSAAEELGLTRNDFFLQTKFTPLSGQDPSNVPYDEAAPLEEQVRQSLQVSLTNLKTAYLDSLVMHSPMPTIEETMMVYRVMESFVDEGKVLRLGISNCYDYRKFTTIYEMARVKPSVLQNRFYADTGFDLELRQFCKEHGIWYQSFWTLTANRHALALNEVRTWAASKQLTPQTLMYAYLMSTGYATPLSGTTNPHHMKEDIAVMERLQGGERIFESESDMTRFEEFLGMH
jgi:diketogulonate reductase-like aldo/keto reductase